MQRLSQRTRELLERESARTERLIGTFRLGMIATFFAIDAATFHSQADALGYRTPVAALYWDGCFLVLALVIRLWLRKMSVPEWAKYAIITVDFAYVGGYAILLRSTFSSTDMLIGMIVSVVPLMILLSALRFSVWATAYAVAMAILVSSGAALVCHASGSTTAYAIAMPGLFGALASYVSHRHRRSIDQVLERIRFERFLPKQVVDQVIVGSTDVELGGRETEVSVLFADIVGFSTLCEQMRPLDVLALLNTFFSAVATVIFRHYGTLDKFIGDAVMAVFGAPLSKPDDVVRAVRCAIDIRDTVANLNAVRLSNGEQAIRFGIAVHTGRVVAGTLGSPERMEYTVVGDCVNVASRIEGLTRQLNQPILVTKATMERAGAAFDFDPLGAFHVKGRQEAVEVFAVRNSSQPS